VAYIGNRVVAGVGSAVKVDLDAPTNALRVKSDGRIGIGKSDPTAPLDVAGQIKATSIATTNNIDIASGATTGSGILNIGANRSGNGYGYIDIVGDTTYTDYGLRLIRSNGGANTNSQLAHRGTGELQLVVQDAGALVAKTSNTERMRIDSSGNVGIGTSSPAYQIDIQGSSNNAFRLKTSSPIFRMEDSDDNAYHTLIASSDDLYITSDAGNTGAGNMIFRNGGSTERMRIDSTGNVGIGTTSPASILEVSATEPYITISSTDSQTGNAIGGIRFDTIDPSYAAGGYPAYITAQDISANGSAFGLVFGTQNAERMRIDHLGNVGIGTSSPNYKLDVQGADLGGTSGDTVDVLQLYSNVGNSSYLNFQKVRTSTGSTWNSAGTRIQQVIDVTKQGYIQFNGDGNDYGISFGKNETEYMRIDTGGDVLPGANGTQDFGSTSLRWANIYTSDLHLNNGIGNYTIVEGEEDLFLYNNKNGKTYKFVLAEVDPSEAPKKMEK